MKNIIIILVCLCVHTCDKQEETGKGANNDFNFKALFQNFKIKNGLKIIEVKKQDYFKGNLSGCNSTFYKGLIKNEMYYLKNQKNDIIVEEYVFDNNTSSKVAFQNILKYSDFTRKLIRRDYNKRCYDIGDEQVYYAVNKDKHIYLLTVINNLFFKDGNTSVEDVVKNNKAILIDDLYENLKK